MSNKERIELVKNTQGIDSIDKKFLNRASKLLKNRRISNFKPIRLPYKAKKNNKKFPNRTKTRFSAINLSSLKVKQKLNAGCTFLISFLITGASLYECQKSYENHYTITYESNLIRLSLIGLSLIQIFLIIFYYLSKLQLKVSYRVISRHSNFLHDKQMLFRLVLEVLLCFVMFPPYYTYSLTFYQISIKQILSNEEIMIGVILLRSIHLLKFIYECSFFSSPRSMFYCNLLEIDNELGFTLKSVLKDSRFISTLALFTLGISALAALEFFYEQGVDSSPLSNIWNCFWLISVTETTIGYGDITSKTHLGRMVSVFSGLFGVFIYTYIVTTVKNGIELTPNESKLTSLIQYKINYKSKVKSSAILLIQRWWRLTLSRHEHLASLAKLFQFQIQLNRFSLVHCIVSQGINPSLSDEISKISENPSIQKLSDYLQPFKPIETKATVLKNLELRSNIRIQDLNNKLRIMLGVRKSTKDVILLNTPRAGRGSIDSSRAIMKKSKLEAVKKLLNVKVQKMSHLGSHQSLSSDEEFYSSKHSSYSYFHD